MMDSSRKMNCVRNLIIPVGYFYSMSFKVILALMIDVSRAAI